MSERSDRDMPGHRVLGLWLLSSCFNGRSAPAFSQVSFTDINPNQSTLHPSDPGRGQRRPR